MRHLILSSLAMVACGETQRDFVTGNELEATSESTSGSVSATENQPVAPPGAQSGHVSEPVTSTSDSSRPNSPNDASLDSRVVDAGQTWAPQLDASVPRSDCEATEYDSLSINEPADFLGVRNMYFYGDGVTTACVTHNRDEVCIEGNAPLSSDGVDEFKYWGAGLGMYLATSTPFDAVAQGIEKVRFSVTNVTGRAVRIAITQVPDPNVADDALNYQNNAFVFGGSEKNDVASDTIVTAALTDFALPNWTHFEDTETGEPSVGQVLNATQLASLQVQLVNGLEDEARAYTYCIGHLEWLDANDEPVVPIDPYGETTETPTAP
jgi:hypothetical protein